MIETDRFNPETGEYSYLNNDGTRITVDWYAFVNVGIDDEEEDDFTNYTNMHDFLRIENSTWDPDARKIICYLRGFLSHDQFWQIKSLAQRGIRATRSNFSSVGRNENVIVDPEFVENDRRWLQKDNYLVCLDQFGEFQL